MAKLSSDGKYVTVEKGDSLWSIAAAKPPNGLGDGSKYKQLATINDIPIVKKNGSDWAFISPGQKIYLSGSGGGSSSKTTTPSNRAVIKQFDLESDVDDSLFVTWTWSKSNTDKYEIQWHYKTKDAWFVQSETTTTYKYSTCSIPSNAVYVRFRVKPISKVKSNKDNKTTYYWTANWTAWEDAFFNVNKSLPPDKPSSAPSVDIEGLKLTMTYDNIGTDTTTIAFQIVKDNSKVVETKKVSVKMAHASYTRTVDAGSEYKVRARAYRGDLASDWTDYSNNVKTPPATPSSITSLKALSDTEVQVTWKAVKNATSYEVQYTNKTRYFDSSSEVRSTTVDAAVANHAEVTGLEAGEEYFFRVRATNEKGESAWTAIKSIVIGKPPAAPTTWSSTTTAIVGEPLSLYWVHNSEDGSTQTFADLELYVGDTKISIPEIEKNVPEGEEEETSYYAIDTTDYPEGTVIKWRVRTAGITKVYGDWSIQRTIDIYAPPNLELDVTDVDGNNIETLESFPFYIRGLAGPNTQAPIGYHVIVSANESYETTDSIGNNVYISEGDAVYSKYFDVNTNPLVVEMSANNIDLENGMSYTVKVTASMNSGLTAEASSEFTVSWVEMSYLPNAEITIDEDVYSATIMPYCEELNIVYHKVNYASGVYTKTDEVIDPLPGEEVAGGVTSTGEAVYSGMTVDGVELYFCTVEEFTPITDILLSVYRREFDGSFTEIASNLDIANGTNVVDPHPALDYARYRITAKTSNTGAVSYYDIPAQPVGGIAAIIQWGEAWSNFDTTDSTDPFAHPEWTGSMLKLPYNIDVSDNNSPDVALVKYIGRDHPTAYYGTQIGQTSSWSMEIEKDDEETLYGLRRLARWMGDVYVREPSGSGYWANVKVSYNQKHKSMTIPVTLDITRVEGGV